MTADLETDSPAPPEAGSTAPRSRWETIVWPRWLPVRARLPLIAQIAGASALIAAIAMPRWSEVPKAPAIPPASAVDAGRMVVAPASTVPPAPVVPEPPRPAHLNLDVRHSFQSVDLSIAVDGKRVLDTTLAGNRKRFGVVGKRAEKSFTKTLDLSPGVRVVRVRVRSEDDKFDQTRVERFDLDSASVAEMKIAADKSGLSVVAERPYTERPAATQVAQETPVAPIAQVAQAAQGAQTAQAAQEASALAELYQTLRQVLIAIAGVVASAATGVFVQEFLKSRRRLMGLDS